MAIETFKNPAYEQIENYVREHPDDIVMLVAPENPVLDSVGYMQSLNGIPGLDEYIGEIELPRGPTTDLSGRHVTIYAPNLKVAREAKTVLEEFADGPIETRLYQN